MNDEPDPDQRAREVFGGAAADVIEFVDAELADQVEETARACAAFVRLARDKGVRSDQIAGMFGGMVCTVLVAQLDA